MPDSFDEFVVGATAGVICSTLLFVAIVAAYDLRSAAVWHAEAVKVGAGEYNNKTCKFQWVNVKPESVCE